MKILTLNAAAREVRLSPDWLRRLTKRGEVTCLRDSSGRRLFRQSDLRRLLRRRGQHAESGDAKQTGQ